MVKTSTKIWLAIACILLIVLGIVCIANPAATLFSAAWMIGCFTLFSGISQLIFTFKTQAFLPNSGTRMLSSILQIILGIIFLGHNLFVTVSLPIIFASWVLVEGIILAVQSFDFKRVGFSGWWGILLLGIAGAILGFLGLKNPDVAGATLSWIIGLGIISLGVSYLLVLCGINRFEKKVGQIRSNIKAAIDEQ